MIPPFDIFRKDPTGNLIWMEATRTLEDAKARIQELAASCPSEYVVFNQITGTKVAIYAGAAGASSQSNPLPQTRQNLPQRKDGSEAGN